MNRNERISPSEYRAWCAYRERASRPMSFLDMAAETAGAAILAAVVVILMLI